MCGIAGVMVRDDRTAVQPLLERLASALIHRGPDGTGYFSSGRVGLANTRLAIVDLAGADQPFEEPKGAALVANGEIYNDLEIRRELADAPYRSGGDCESALHLYRRKGLDFAEELRGMYAIALYDPERSRMVLTRDPFGIKQLYYVVTDAYFAFASEPQALRAAGLAGGLLNPQRRSELLQLKFTTGSQTIYADIERVLPGETLVVTDGQIVERRRRHALPRTQPQTSMDVGQVVDRLDAVLKESVQAHLRSDVPYGLFLSGGIDSSALALLMSQVSSSPIIAFTAGFPDVAAADETQAACRIARAVDAEHHVVQMTQKDFWAFAPRVAAAIDDPTADAAALPTFMLAEAAKSRLKVVLTGEGADELFGGYSRYARTRSFWRLLGKKKSRMRGVFDSFTGKESPFERWRDGLHLAESEGVSAKWSAMQTLQAVDCAEWLPNDLLVKFDRCLMAHGVEGRTPFLDPRVAAFVFCLPDEMKVRSGLGKWLLRQWLAKALPEAEAWTRKKGFNPPVGHWIAFNKDEVERLVMSQPGVREMEIESVVRSAYSDPVRHSQAAWSLLFYALWHSRHVLGIDSGGSIGDVLGAAARAA
jgi:asparagine synthase (glutamine-hydrolysing)